MISDNGILVINCGLEQLEAVKNVYQNFFSFVQPADRELGQTRVLTANDTIYEEYRKEPKFL